MQNIISGEEINFPHGWIINLQNVIFTLPARKVISILISINTFLIETKNSEIKNKTFEIKNKILRWNLNLEFLISANS